MAIPGLKSRIWIGSCEKEFSSRVSFKGQGIYYTNLDLANYYRRYCETILAVDESLGRIIKSLEKSGEFENTLVIYLGDNGFLFGEHGLIDKRCAYEESIRIPLIMRFPKRLTRIG